MPKTRRVFILTSLVFCGVAAWTWNKGIMAKFFHILSRVKTKFRNRTSSIPFEERPFSTLPDQWQSVSVEMALNSRCTSDSDGDQTHFHWGLEDDHKRLPQEVIADIAKKALLIPEFAGGRADVHVERNELSFTVPDSHDDETVMNRNMIQSGVRMQAVGLMAAAMGIGYGFRSYGENGRSIGGRITETVKLVLNPMQPSYQGAHWSKLTPEGPQAWRKGNLPDPSRDGRMPLFSAMDRLQSKCPDGEPVTSIRQLGQLLWGCKGRTPHMYLGKRWGLTIPTYKGHQELTHLVFADSQGARRYINWEADRPTHSLQRLPDGHPMHRLSEAVLEKHPPFNCLIMWSPQEESGRAYWEIGFQLCNFIVQAAALGLAYEVFDLNSIDAPASSTGSEGASSGMAVAMTQRMSME